jgi:hypothetical protein
MNKIVRQQNIRYASKAPISKPCTFLETINGNSIENDRPLVGHNPVRPNIWYRASTKSQIISKFQFRITENRLCFGIWSFGDWKLFGIWDLGFGYWDFPAKAGSGSG